MIINAQNEGMKKKYAEFLESAKRLSLKTVNMKLKSLYRFDDFIRQTDYKTFNKVIARDFQSKLKQPNSQGSSLSAKTIYQSLRDVQEFLYWLSDKPGYKSRIHREDIQYLNPSKSITQMANNRPPRAYPFNLAYLKRLIVSIRGTEELDLRDKAMIATLIMTGIRAEALATLAVGCVDMDHWTIDQDPAKGVKTKFRKRIHTVILKIDSIFSQALEDWFKFLIARNVPTSYPLFPKAELSQEQGTFSFINNKVSDRFMLGSQVSHILKRRCSDARETYYSAHSIRHLHERVLEKVCPKTEQIKAISQNMGHEKLATTLFSYGYISDADRMEILKNLDFRGLD